MQPRPERVCHRSTAPDSPHCSAHGIDRLTDRAHPLIVAARIHFDPDTADGTAHLIEQATDRCAHARRRPDVLRDRRHRTGDRVKRCADRGGDCGQRRSGCVICDTCAAQRPTDGRHGIADGIAISPRRIHHTTGAATCQTGADTVDHATDGFQQAGASDARQTT